MKTFRSKSNLVFGIIFFAVIFIYEIPMYISVMGRSNIVYSSLLLLIVPLLISIYMLVVGLQIICIDEKGVSLKIFGIKLKELAWNDINEAGIGKINLNKKKYVRQLYVSVRRIKESELKNMNCLRFQPGIIWFDYSLTAQKHLAFHLGMTDSID